MKTYVKVFDVSTGERVEIMEYNQQTLDTEYGGNLNLMLQDIYDNWDDRSQYEGIYETEHLY